ncbi:hypothetical protein BVRB_027180, partial [Beta vulgaris subsp. vulgaris]
LPTLPLKMSPTQSLTKIRSEDGAVSDDTHSKEEMAEPFSASVDVAPASPIKKCQRCAGLMISKYDELLTLMPGQCIDSGCIDYALELWRHMHPARSKVVLCLTRAFQKWATAADHSQPVTGKDVGNYLLRRRKNTSAQLSSLKKMK